MCSAITKTEREHIQKTINYYCYGYEFNGFNTTCISTCQQAIQNKLLLDIYNEMLKNKKGSK